MISTCLLPVCLKACNIMAPLIHRIYIGEYASSIKSDMSVVTLADTIVQSLLRQLLTPVTAAFIGEESSEEYEALAEEVAAVKLALQALELPDLSALKLTAFIDPIDGTAEFSSGKGHESTICIGFAQETPVAGLIFCPLVGTYAMGCRSESFFSTNVEHGELDCTTILTSNGRISPFIEGLGLTRLAAGGCGNKILMVLEGRGVYILDRGVSRWDTCAAQAILEAEGGILCKLTGFMEGRTETYSYAVTDVNRDPNPAAILGPMNSQDAILKPYSNLCGMVALPRAAMPLIQKLREVCLRSSIPVYS